MQDRPKPTDEAIVRIQTIKANKHRWVSASRNRGMKLSDWICEHLNDAAAIEFANDPQFWED